MLLKMSEKPSLTSNIFSSPLLGVYGILVGKMLWIFFCPIVFFLLVGCFFFFFFQEKVLRLRLSKTSLYASF